MSGILGICHLDGRPVGCSDLEGMMASMVHRGPDGRRVWSEGAVGLGHQMLCTTPESLDEKLPLANRTNDLVITADARIDNRNELIKLPGFQGRPPENISDGELILAAYEEWGELCTERLLGDFAFAIWDSRRQTLFCARDHFGVKPFYYYLSDGLFAFASEIKALLCLPEVPRRLNEEKVADYLAEVLDDKRGTFFKDILRLPPGHSIAASCQGSRLQSYWSLDSSREVRLHSDQEYAEALREIFTEAVRCRLRSPQRVGLFLSGGLDSSSIACVARNLLAQDGTSLPTFSIVFDETPECDERRYINFVVAQQGFEPHYMCADPLGPFAYLERILRQQYEPPIGVNLFLMWELYNRANRQGVRVLLDGFDGDGTVSHGYGYLGELGHARRWLTLALELTALNKRRGSSHLRSLRTYGRRYALKPLLAKSRTLRGAQKIGKALRRRIVTRPNLSETPAWCANLNDEFVQRLNLAERRRAAPSVAACAAKSEREWHHRVVMQGAQTNLLEESANTAAAFSLEPRHPFWDKRLVEFCLSLPPQQKLHRGWSRLVMRRAMSGILPPQIQWRGTKTDFGQAFSRSLLVADRERLENLLHGNAGVEQQYVDLNDLRLTYERLVKGEDGIAPLQMFAFTNAMSLSVWLRLFWPAV